MAHIHSIVYQTKASKNDAPYRYSRIPAKYAATCAQINIFKDSLRL